MNGETIYGARGNPPTSRSWGVSTQKGNKIYVLNGQAEAIVLPKLGKKVLRARVCVDKSWAKYLKNEYGVSLSVPNTKFNPIHTKL